MCSQPVIRSTAQEKSEGRETQSKPEVCRGQRPRWNPLKRQENDNSLHVFVHSTDVYCLQYAMHDTRPWGHSTAQAEKGRGLLGDYILWERIKINMLNKNKQELK